MMENDLIEMLGMDPDAAKAKADDLADRNDHLTVLTPTGDYRYPLSPNTGLEKLRGRYTGDNRHPSWQQAPILIHATLPSMLAVLLSEGSSEAAGYVAACAVHIQPVPMARLQAVVVLWDGMRYRIHTTARDR